MKIRLGELRQVIREELSEATSRRERDIAENPEIAPHVAELERRAGGRITEIHDKRERDEDYELEEGGSNIFDVVFTNCIVTVIFSRDFRSIAEWHVWDK
jgi:hypothetical protein